MSSAWVLEAASAGATPPELEPALLASEGEVLLFTGVQSDEEDAVDTAAPDGWEAEGGAAATREAPAVGMPLLELAVLAADAKLDLSAVLLARLADLHALPEWNQSKIQADQVGQMITSQMQVVFASTIFNDLKQQALANVIV